MAAELMGAKMLAPFYGSSLYVWASVMAVTLVGLAGGYFAGGILSSKTKSETKLYWTLLTAGAFTILMPFTAKLSFLVFGAFSLIPAVIITSLVVLFPPVFMMGMVSPLIIRQIATDAENAGRVSGTVYAISTVGGILATFLFGFYIIPFVGLTIPSVFTGIILGIIPCMILVKKNFFNAFAFLPVAAWAITTSFSSPAQTNMKIIYSSEGLLGQIYVIDYPNEIYYGDSTRKGTYSRWLYVNRISQTMDDPFANPVKGEERYFTYVYKIAQSCDSLLRQGKNKALLLGLGGGSVAKYLTEKGWEVEACELDERIVHVAQTYFELPASVNVTKDDARHYINLCEKKYDIIIFDVFKGEETPSHVLTTECLEKVKTLLNKNGMLFLNSFGFIEGERGKGMRSLYKTLSYSGFDVKVLATSPDENQRNLVFVASNTAKIFNSEEFLSLEKVNFDDAYLLTDERPCFELINSRAALSWRSSEIFILRNNYYEKELPVFE